MFKDDLDKLEVTVLEKRLTLLKARGAYADRVFSLGDDFYDLMADHWIFGAVLSTIHSFQEMHSDERDEAVGKALNYEANEIQSRPKKRGRKPKCLQA